ncbi:MAG TPA: hypothetical protein VFB83_01795 [Propionibacteriaceae bacterium]|jgi:hypothetical protein|nr:hypothetical protein [Propionibacteriaceae bacterium]
MIVATVADTHRLYDDGRDRPDDLGHRHNRKIDQLASVIAALNTATDPTSVVHQLLSTLNAGITSQSHSAEWASRSIRTGSPTTFQSPIRVTEVD